MSNQEIAISTVSKVTGVAVSAILSRRRMYPEVEARQLIVLLLHRDGATDQFISLVLKRKRCAILKSRHNALDALRYSKSFRAKFDKASAIYEQQKSLRISQD